MHLSQSQPKFRTIESSELGSILRQHKFERFRLEAEPNYNTPGKLEPHFTDYVSGEYFPRTQRLDFKKRLEGDKEAGRALLVVRTLPLGWFKMPYIRCEVDFYIPENLDWGADVRFLVNAEQSQTHLDKIHSKGDFWLVDRDMAIEMGYDDTGRWTHARTPEDIGEVATYREVRELSLNLSISAREFYQRYRKGDIPL